MTSKPGTGLTEPGEPDANTEFRMTVPGIYNSRLTARTQAQGTVKKEKDLLNKAEPLARMINCKEFEDVNKGLGITVRAQPSHNHLPAAKNGDRWASSFDRFASNRAKQGYLTETSAEATQLTTSELLVRMHPRILQRTVKRFRAFRSMRIRLSRSWQRRNTWCATECHAVAGAGKVTGADLHLLTKEEAEVCNVLRLMQKRYAAIKKNC
ncbi:hypothetical protein DTO027I6_10078 [Penicillium roqueforti]|nr:hypothetical protein CBS147337_10249 [Penicillium roqueforti]KAI3182969.1 hypothetical protein DTO027I6_10078 [Penicillium roqueforti]